jgi:hypothetical protein
MIHLTRDERLQALEDGLAPRRRRHLERCAVCRADVDALDDVLRAVRATQVPEPSPLFWDHFSSRVRDAVALEPTPIRPWWKPVRRPRLVSLSAAALVVVLVALGWVARRGATETPIETSVAGVAAGEPDPDAAATDEEWGLLLSVADDSAWSDDEGLAWSSRPGQSELTVSDLTAEEQAALVSLLNEAIAAPAPGPRSRPG